LRHTSATNYLVNGGDVISLQRKLGHSSLTMTDRYVHLASDQAAAQERVAPMDKLDVKLMPVPKAKQPYGGCATKPNALSCADVTGRSTIAHCHPYLGSRSTGCLP